MHTCIAVPQTYLSRENTIRASQLFSRNAADTYRPHAIVASRHNSSRAGFIICRDNALQHTRPRQTSLSPLPRIDNNLLRLRLHPSTCNLRNIDKHTRESAKIRKIKLSSIRDFRRKSNLTLREIWPVDGPAKLNLVYEESGELTDCSEVAIGPTDRDLCSAELDWYANESPYQEEIGVSYVEGENRTTGEQIAGEFPWMGPVAIDEARQRCTVVLNQIQ